VTYEEFTAEVLHEAKAAEGANNSYASHVSQWQATLQCLDWREAEEFRHAIEQFLPEGDFGPRTLEVIRYVGSASETNQAWPTRAVKLITALAQDHEEVAVRIASQPPSRRNAVSNAPA